MPLRKQRRPGRLCQDGPTSAGGKGRGVETGGVRSEFFASVFGRVRNHGLPEYAAYVVRILFQAVEFRAALDAAASLERKKQCSIAP